jgi:dUTP pyrophosphatase
MEPVVIKFKKLDPNAVIPSYAHDGDVGMDMTAISVEYDEKRDMYIYHTGLACESDKWYGMFLFPRSSNSKTEAYLTNSVGIVDSFLYRGEIQFRYKNRDRYRKGFWEWLAGKVDVERALKKAPYQVGDRIGQMVILPYPKVECWEFNELSDTERGKGGFGSTGK